MGIEEKISDAFRNHSIASIQSDDIGDMSRAESIDSGLDKETVKGLGFVFGKKIFKKNYIF